MINGPRRPNDGLRNDKKSDGKSLCGHVSELLFSYLPSAPWRRRRLGRTCCSGLWQMWPVTSQLRAFQSRLWLFEHRSVHSLEISLGGATCLHKTWPLLSSLNGFEKQPSVGCMVSSEQLYLTLGFLGSWDNFCGPPNHLEDIWLLINYRISDSELF